MREEALDRIRHGQMAPLLQLEDAHGGEELGSREEPVQRVLFRRTGACGVGVTETAGPQEAVPGDEGQGAAGDARSLQLLDEGVLETVAKVVHGSFPHADTLTSRRGPGTGAEMEIPPRQGPPRTPR